MKRIPFIFLAALLLCSCGRSTIDSALQERCQFICDSLVNAGQEVGMQFCVYRDGKCIVDVCSGHLTKEEGAPEVTPSTLFAIFSAEKPMLSTAVHRAVEMGLMDYDKPLNTWWPEFTGDGKDSLTLRLTLAYRSGMPASFDPEIFPTERDRADWDKVLAWAASVKPEYPIGGPQKYLSYSYAWMLGHPLEVAYGKPLKDALDELVLEPAGISDEFYFAVPDEELERIATAYGKSIEAMNSDTLRRACLPSAWGVASARAIAKFYNRLCGFDGKEPLVKPSTLADAIVPLRAADDPIPADIDSVHRMIFGMGYGVWGKSDDISRVFGHGGAGGSAAGLACPATRMTIGLTCNDSKGSSHARYHLLKAVGFDWRLGDYPDALL